jgi:hypothetical protein
VIGFVTQSPVILGVVQTMLLSVELPLGLREIVQLLTKP